MQRDPLGFLSQMALGQDVVKLVFGEENAYLVTLPHQVQYVLQDAAPRFRRYSRVTRRLALLLGQGLFTSEGTDWLSQRRIVQPAFQRSRLSALTRIAVDEATRSLGEWAGAGGHPMDLAAEMMRLTRRINARLLFGLDARRGGDEIIDALVEALRTLAQADQPGAAGETMSAFHRARAALDGLIQRAIDLGRACPSEDGFLLNALLESPGDAAGGGWSDAHLRDQLVTLFLGAYESTGACLSWVWHLLSCHPAIEAELHVEVERELGGRPPAFEDLDRLPYLKMVVNEALRLYPPSWLSPLESTEELSIDGVLVPSGTVVFVSSYVVHRSPKVWNDPERFDPTRFHPGASPGRSPFAFFPFGGGPRQCIGSHLALVIAHVAVAMISQGFELRPASSEAVVPRPRDTLHPERLEMIATPRH